MAAVYVQPNRCNGGRAWILWNFFLAIGLIAIIVVLSSQIFPRNSQLRVAISSASFAAADSPIIIGQVSGPGNI